MHNLIFWLRRIAAVFLFITLMEIILRTAGYLYLTKIYISNFKVTSTNINIVCLGESSTGGLGVDWQDSYPKQLEATLRKFYRNQNIKVIVPPHNGQNTSQASNRIGQYISLYKPVLIILMVGANNEWSFAESNVGRFIDRKNREALKVQFFVILDKFRLFKLLRFLYLRFIAKDTQYSNKVNRYYIWGHPERMHFPPSEWIHAFAKSNRNAFVSMWEYDVRRIIQEVRKYNINVLLMTYHINPKYLTAENFISIAEEQKILLVRNDESFSGLIREGTINNYLLHDNWHPNKQGHAIIANNAFEYIINYNLLSLK